MADYSSTAEVVAIVRYLMSDEVEFNADTIPTLVEVGAMQTRISNVLNMAFSSEGFAVPINTTNANSTAKSACDHFVVNEVAQMIEIAHPSRTFSGEESRVSNTMTLVKRAQEFVELQAYGLKVIGATQARKTSDGLIYTGLDKKSQRSDPDDNTREQPKFTRDQFDEGGSQADSTSIWSS